MASKLPALIADGGELTVLRRLVNFLWGQWNVEWPEGFEPPELEEGHKLGYVGVLGARDVGLSARRFVRADATIVAKDDQVDPPEVGSSNVEELFDTTIQRTSGDTFFERDITNKGIGALLPQQDFFVGDRVPVRLWNRILPAQLVTSVKQTSTPDQPLGWLVHIGGQIVGDSVERTRQNKEIERAIMIERREREEQTERATRIASRAEAVASQAFTVAESASDVAGKAIDDARSAQEVARKADLTSEAGRKQAIEALGIASEANTTAISANRTSISANQRSIDSLNKAQAAQNELNNQQKRINEQQTQINAQQVRINQMVARPLGAEAGKVDEDEMGRLEVSATNAVFYAKGDWTGKVYIQVSFTALNNYTRLFVANVTPRSSQVDLKSYAFQGVRDVFCTYKVYGGQQ